MTTRMVRLYAGQAVRLVSARGYSAAATATKPSPVPAQEQEQEAESSSAAQRRLTPEASKPKRRRGPNATSLLRAQKLARAILESVPPPSAIDIDIGSPKNRNAGNAQETNMRLEPTLDDLEAKRPTRPPPPLEARRYPKVYKKLYDELDNAFVAKQLLKLASELGVRTPKGRNKGLAIKGILRTWGWHPPLPPQAPKLRQVTMEREWQLGRAELWLLFQARHHGTREDEDGILQQGVTFSVLPSSSGSGAVVQEGGSRTVLRGSGIQEALETMDDLISDRISAIEQHTRTVTIDHDPSSLGVIATASAAYIESVSEGGGEGKGRLRISAISDDAVGKATALLIQSGHHASTRLSIPRSIVTPTDQQLALYPHLPSPAGSIPWQDLGRAVRPLFRLRTVQPWETKVGPREIAHVAEKLDQAIGHPVGQGSPGPAISLGEMIEPKEADGQTITTLRFGHFVYPDTSPTASSLSPPSRDRLTPTDAAQSEVLAARPVFLPGLPPSTIHFPLNEKPRTERRLRYRDPTGRILELTHLVKQADPQETRATQQRQHQEGDSVHREQESGWKGELDDMLSRLNVDELDADTDAEPAVTNESSAESVSVQARILAGKRTDVMLPDRPTDMRITTSSSSTTTLTDSEFPSEITTYLAEPTTAAPPSTHLQLDGVQWELVSALELEITESDLSSPSPALGLGLDAPPGGQVMSRTVKATDLTFGMGRHVRYAELETHGLGPGPLSPSFWAELAKVTRVLAPGAGALRREIF